MLAYILIETSVGRAGAVASAVTAIDGIAACDVVAGPYDVICRADAGSMDEIGRLVVGRIQAVEGVTRTLICPIVSLD